MSVEDLMKVRYKVIAEMPLLPFKIGEIYSADFVPVMVAKQQEYIRLDIYPHLFKKLKWYEERDEKDMPEYLKIISGHFRNDYNKIGKTEYSKNNKSVTVWFTNKSASHRPIGDTIPATEQQYLNYIKTTKTIKL